jgi:hypothetical protein
VPRMECVTGGVGVSGMARPKNVVTTLLQVGPPFRVGMVHAIMSDGPSVCSLSGLSAWPRWSHGPVVPQFTLFCPPPTL